ncbi:ApaLI family restriction endonuclease [Ruegeria arenilitoris]|uniref:ApaLI family restriction endonuclease n=1 Tax=Ruegeria arenilitoris TaxID=1173585 RepID=UPI00147B49AA|nr:ApaLI family restriction endonuclease [Ruegeria arenilitoris]
MTLKDKIHALADRYRRNLSERVEERVKEMQGDDNRHYMLYNALGVSDDEGSAIDVYQNKGRFLYKYAGSFMEEAAILCLKDCFENAKTLKIPNTVSARPKQYEIDCLVDDRDAFEIKWRDATTDGDHINKEHARMRAVAEHGYVPIRLMFFEPLRSQAVKIQSKLRTLYVSEGGAYYSGQDAWDFMVEYANVDLKAIIEEVAQEELAENE